MNKKLLIIIWGLVIICPLAWLSSLSVRSDEMYHQVADAEWVHIVAHMVLYIVFGIIWQLSSPNHPNLGNYIKAVIVIALVQEGLQNLLKYPNPQPFIDVLFDWGVDIVSAAIGWFAGKYLVQLRIKQFSK